MATLDSGARVTAVQVMEIIDTELTEAQVNAMINSAHRIMGATITEITDTDLLTTIELWLSAHFVAIYDQRAASETIADYSVTFQGKTAMGLQATTYGQQAMSLDYSGALASLGLKKATLHLV